MLVSKKMIQQWVDIEKISDEEISNALNNLGLEVEEVINLSKQNTNLIVGEVISLKPHPLVERLNVCDVNIGDKVLNIVCGANNVVVGIKVVVAQIGSQLANGLKIDYRDLKGITSHGMICSLSEIGLLEEVLTPADLQGIVHLPKDSMVGDLNPLKYLNLDDSIFEIQLTLNRSDCLSAYSIAQELATYFNKTIKALPIVDLNDVKISNEQLINDQENVLDTCASLNVKVNNKINDFNNNLILRILQLCKVKVNNIYDALNSWVMLEVGQPLLLFNNENIGNLSFKKNDIDDKKFLKNDFVFCDDKNLINNLISFSDEKYEVNENSSNLLFLSFNMDLNIIQRQLKNNGVSANSLIMQRLSKPIVFDHYLIILQRLLFLLKANDLNFEVIKFNNQISYVTQENAITFPWNKINKILGSNFEYLEILKSLEKIGCKVSKEKNSDLITVAPSAHRNDLNNVNDYSEEVARIIGFEKITEVKPKILINFQPQTKLEQLIKKAQDFLLNQGFNQAKTYSLTSKENLKDFNFFNYSNQIVLSSPLTSSREVMRFSLVESLLTISKNNLLYKQENLLFFSNDAIYFDDNKSNHHVAFIINENDVKDKYKTNNNGFYFIKAILTSFLNKEIANNFCDKLEYKIIENNSILHPFLSTDLFFKSTHLATIGTFHPSYINKLGVNSNFYFAEINFTRLQKIQETEYNSVVKFSNWSKYNPLSRDISLIVNEEVNYLDIKKAIKNIKNLLSIKLIDEYSDEKLKAENKKSLTFNFQFNSHSNQLDENQIISEIEKIQKILKDNFHALIR